MLGILLLAAVLWVAFVLTILAALLGFFDGPETPA